MDNSKAYLFYRGHTYKFEEFLMIWTDELKSREPTTMTVRLQKDVDKYKVRLFCEVIFLEVIIIYL